MAQPALVKMTTMREAFFQAFHREPRHPLKKVISKKIKGNAGRIYHRKGWFVTRSNQE